MKKLLIINTGGTTQEARAKMGDFEDWIANGAGFSVEQTDVVAVYQGNELPDATRYGGIIITGSHAMVTDREPWSEYTARWLRESAGAGVPVLGICYGHQLLAQAFGGVVTFHPDGPENGTVPIHLTGHAGSDPLFADLPAAFKAQVSHSQTVSSLPEGAVLLAYNDFEPHHGFRVGSHIWGVQFHPEFTVDATRYYVEKQRSKLEALGLDVDGMAAGVQECPWGTELLRRFVALAMEN